MMNAFVYLLLFVIGFMLVWLSYQLPVLSKASHEEGDDARHDKLSLYQGLVYTALLLVLLSAVAFTWQLVRDTPWEGHLMEWLNIVVRLLHITFGIAWIGASFYFVFLENALNRTKGLRDELAGNLWAVHGGGFYYLEKYKVAPKQIPRDLHWFKYEAYFTWLSGFCLLFVVYYFNAKGFLIDQNVRALTPVGAISIGVGSFVVAWTLYHLLCKTPLVRTGPLFGLIGLAIAVGFAYFYSQMFSARAAYIHFGAMLGTLMAGNVFFIIIPAQKAMVAAAKSGLPLNPALGKFAGLRSLHNNYLTLPVLFVMISNHFPSTFGNAQGWLVLGIITVGTAGVKHWLNLREKGQLNLWVLPVSAAILLGAAFMTAPPKNPGACNGDVADAAVQGIVQQRCMTCHSTRPTDDVFTAPPNGVVFESPQDLLRLKDKVLQRVVVTKTMPQNNKTGMTEEERNQIRCWLGQQKK